LKSAAHHINTLLGKASVLSAIYIHIRPKIIMPILLIFPSLLFAQAPTPKEVETYAGSVDSLMAKRALQKYFFPNMSFCGGALYGYYYQSKLVYIDATYAGELGFTNTKVYFKDTTVYKIIYRKYVPEWTKFYSKYPNADRKLEEKKMTYTDTTYTLVLSKPIAITKTARKGYSQAINEGGLSKHLLYCAYEMKKELETERTPIFKKKD
jgi:hypothetical protein